MCCHGRLVLVAPPRQEVCAQTLLSVSHPIIPVWLLVNWHRLLIQQGDAAGRDGKRDTKKLPQRSWKKWGSSDVHCVNIYMCVLNEEKSVLKRGHSFGGCWVKDFHRHVAPFFFAKSLPLLSFHYHCSCNSKEPENCPVCASSPVTFQKIDDVGGLFFSARWWVCDKQGRGKTQITAGHAGCLYGTR